MSELDSLVRDLTDLKGLVGGVNGGDGSATIPEQSLASRQQNPLISRAPLNLAQENMRRPSEAAGQLERLMDDLSLEAGEILDSNRSGADVKQDSTSRSGGVDDGSGRSTGNSNDANSPSVSPANTDISKSDKAHPNDAEAIADPTSDGIARSREDGTFQSPSPSLPQSDSWQGIRLPERQTATDNLSAQPSGPLKEAKNTSPKSCAVCNQPLSGPIVNAMGRAYHPEHFKCYNCSRLLGNGRFFEKEGNAFCESCWQVNLPKCAYCDGPITEVRVLKLIECSCLLSDGFCYVQRCITALGQHWHPNHFFCAQCGKSFPPGAGFLEKDGMAYCEEDYFALFAMHCGGCGKGIIGEFVSACGKEWHMGCFVCVVRRRFKGWSKF